MNIEQDIKTLIFLSRHGMVQPTFHRLRCGEIAIHVKALHDANMAMGRALALSMEFIQAHYKDAEIDPKEGHDLIMAIEAAITAEDPEPDDSVYVLQSDDSGRIDSTMPVRVERHGKEVTAYHPSVSEEAEDLLSSLEALNEKTVDALNVEAEGEE